ncbi:protein translocase subunit SecF [Candidatus Nucleicultrix amoebiphila]|jgi:preprotein translocase SecF subunit|uniref:protein translocase subunit SecF n=1 Tax=Candidatus Nucleicultrix amoebiphila TaxID=1509244 RepID=UPI000A26D6A1|nr:protein translocase subunit SecF [Candidatus Nucleicultrix amoebiphila]
MKGFQFVPVNTNIPFTGTIRYVSYLISLIMVVGSIGLFFVKGLNYGIDFKGGFLIEVRTQAPADLSKMRAELNALNFGEAKLQEFGSNRDVMIRIERQHGDEKAQSAALEKIKETLGPDVEYRRVETVGPKVSADLIRNGGYAVAFAIILILLYIWIRFEWQFGLCCVISLMHDCISVVGFYSLFNVEFSETAFVAILTTLGYSVNDTVVIYDRIRDNLRKYKKTPLNELVNRSTNETLSRTVMTSSTTMMALLGLYFFGGPVISVFSLPILVGIFVGTLSSIFVSANLLLHFNIRRQDVEQTAN